MEKGLEKFLLSIDRSSIKGVADDSRKVHKNYIFVAVRGMTVDGHKFIPQARKSGAKLVIGENGDIDFKVSNSRKALSIVASWFYDYPLRKLKIVGVTGTDGKTTTSTLIYWVLKVSGKKVGLVSTVSAKIGDEEYDTGFHVTNPEPLELQRFLSLMIKKECKYAVLEVTSHGLDQDRVSGINFDIGVLTNITHEHLDYHKTMANYIKAKAKLFINSKISVLNNSYPVIKKYIGNKTKKVYYNAETLPSQLLKTVRERFIEPYNVLNATATYLTIKSLKVSDKDFGEAIKSFPGIEGRMQEVPNKKGIRIIVDFAHTPNALKNVLMIFKKQSAKGSNIICVFGCAGERDIRKRPMMAKISTDLADVSVFTAEDPRHEKVEDIVFQMMKGVRNKKAVVYQISDRQEAISTSINKIAKKGDIVVICGKGHEKSMNFNGVEYPWSDQKAVLAVLSK